MNDALRELAATIRRNREAKALETPALCQPRDWRALAVEEGMIEPAQPAPKRLVKITVKPDKDGWYRVGPEIQWDAPEAVWLSDKQQAEADGIARAVASGNEREWRIGAAKWSAE